MVDANASPQVPSSPPTTPPQPRIRRKLIPNLPAADVHRKILEAERLAEAGEREQAFYLDDFKTRRLFQGYSCRSFSEYIRKRTGIGTRKAQDLARVGRKLLKLPALDLAFARGEVYWSAVRAAVTVAEPDTDAAWAEYARTHLVREVERRAAAARPHEDLSAGKGPQPKPKMNAALRSSFLRGRRTLPRIGRDTRPPLPRRLMGGDAYGTSVVVVHKNCRATRKFLEVVDQRGHGPQPKAKMNAALRLFFAGEADPPPRRPRHAASLSSAPERALSANRRGQGSQRS